MPSLSYVAVGLYVYDNFSTYSTSTRYKTNTRITTMALQRRSIVYWIPVLFWNARFVAFMWSSALPSRPRFRFRLFSDEKKKKSRDLLHGGFPSEFS